MAIDSVNIRAQHMARHELVDQDKPVTEFTQPAIFEENELQEEIAAAMGDLAELISEFGNTGRGRGNGKGSSIDDKNFIDVLLEESAEKKVSEIVSVLAKSNMGSNALLQYVRSLFPDDSDLMLALYELRRQRKLSQAQKKEIEKAISEHEKFSDMPKIQSGMNIGQVAKKFSKGDSKLSPMALRSCYLDFLEMDHAASCVYRDWIERFGADNRNRLLAFMLRALVCDMRSHICGFNSDEFGPLSAKLSDVNTLTTFDEKLVSSKNKHQYLTTRGCKDEDLLHLLFSGLLECHNFEKRLIDFNKKYLLNLRIKELVIFLQNIKSIYTIVPDHFYANDNDKDILLQKIINILSGLFKTEKIYDAQSFYADEKR
ncbi:type III secretion system gatekeeper subunit SctW [Hafnia paralvei]|uniref:type III secretion system gatekeeper subunit SctW n=1 Tax=Hafnia paralvei TaxID=546367 RepID=UPI00300C2701